MGNKYKLLFHVVPLIDSLLESGLAEEVQNSALPTFDRSRSGLSTSSSSGLRTAVPSGVQASRETRDHIFHCVQFCGARSKREAGKIAKDINCEIFAIYWDRISKKWWTSMNQQRCDGTWLDFQLRFWQDCVRSFILFCRQPFKGSGSMTQLCKLQGALSRQRRGGLFSVCAWCISKALCSFVARAVGLNSPLGPSATAAA